MPDDSRYDGPILPPHPKTVGFPPAAQCWRCGGEDLIFGTDRRPKGWEIKNGQWACRYCLGKAHAPRVFQCSTCRHQMHYSGQHDKSTEHMHELLQGDGWVIINERLVCPTCSGNGGMREARERRERPDDTEAE